MLVDVQSYDDIVGPDGVFGTADDGPLGDYRPLPGSPVIDAGSNLYLDEIDSDGTGPDLEIDLDGSDVIGDYTIATDLSGGSRILDGNGDWTATVDRGAYESPRVTTAIVVDSLADGPVNLADGNTTLRDALALAEPEGYIRTFADCGEPMARLLRQAAARGIMPGYAVKLLAAFGAGAKGELAPSPQPLVEPLSPRELEVLKLIAQGLSNREIAEQLVVALTTVKGHSHRIYGKLQVQRRTEAVARARKLGPL